MESTVLRARDDFHRVHSRIVDSVQFKIQREINIRDDEISRLKSDLAFLRGKVHTAADTANTSQKQIAERRSRLQMKVAEAKTNADMRQTKLAIEHGNVMHELESRHHAEVAALGSKLEAVMFSRQPDDPDPIDEFLEAMRPAQTTHKPDDRPKPTDGFKTTHPIHRFAHIGSGRAQTDLAKKHDNFARIEQLDGLEDEIRAQEDLAGKLRAKIQNVLKNPPEIEPDRDIETRSLRESLRASHAQKRSDLEEQLRAEVDRGRAINAAIVRAKEEAEQAIRTSKKTAPKTRIGKKRSRVGSLSTGVRHTRVATLRAENKSLKKEIARVDFLLYGRNGKYQMWKGIV
jgi:hypothetical protein